MINKDLLLDLVNSKNIILEHVLNKIASGDLDLATKHLKLAMSGNDNIASYIEEEL